MFAGRVLLLFVLAFAALAPSASAAGFTHWQPAGALSQPRLSPMAALLQDGRVLVAGGQVTQGTADTLASTELYDPATNTWAPGAPMAEHRTDASTVVLRDGRVLVAGGYRSDLHRAIATAELYDPRTNTWAAAGSLIAPRARVGAVLLPDGRVLVAGVGNPALGAPAAPAAEIYDPATNAWTATGPMTTARTRPAVALLPGGRVLAAGGAQSGSLATAEVYDPASNAWTPAAAMAAPRERPGVATLPDGRVLVAGGEFLHAPLVVGDGSLSSAEVFDPATGTWAPAGPLARRRGEEAQLVTLTDGRPLFVAGGWSVVKYTDGRGSATSGGALEATSELYDPATGTWTDVPHLSGARQQHAVVVLPDGSVLVVGGTTDGTAERLIPAPPAAPAPVPPPPLPQAAKPGVLKFVGVPKRMRPSRTSTVTVKLRCTGGPCRDQVRLKSGRRLVAQRAVTAAAGRTVTVRLKLDAATRRAVARRAVRVTLALSQPRTTAATTLRAR